MQKIIKKCFLPSKPSCPIWQWFVNTKSYFENSMILWCNSDISRRSDRGQMFPLWMELTHLLMKGALIWELFYHFFAHEVCYSTSLWKASSLFHSNMVRILMKLLSLSLSPAVRKCPDSVDCTLQRRHFCKYGSSHCGPCLSPFEENEDGRCVLRTRHHQHGTKFKTTLHSLHTQARFICSHCSLNKLKLFSDILLLHMRLVSFFRLNCWTELINIFI